MYNRYCMYDIVYHISCIPADNFSLQLISGNSLEQSDFFREGIG